MQRTFTFGQNWEAFARRALTPERVDEARAAFRTLTDGIDLQGKQFLDIGFGQGLALFLAQEAGARVRGIDLDPQSERALDETARLFPGAVRPSVQIASILDPSVVQAELAGGGYDVVHSWGVLHHTGNMALAFVHAMQLVRPGGYFIVAIYNRHWTAPIWWGIKRVFAALPPAGQHAMVMALYPLMQLRMKTLPRDAVYGRGMDIYFDTRDWLGGFPYEYASRDEIRRRVETAGFATVREIPLPVAGTGCNQFVFQKPA